MAPQQQNKVEVSDEVRKIIERAKKAVAIDPIYLIDMLKSSGQRKTAE